MEKKLLQLEAVQQAESNFDEVMDFNAFVKANGFVSAKAVLARREEGKKPLMLFYVKDNPNPFVSILGSKAASRIEESSIADCRDGLKVGYKAAGKGYDTDLIVVFSEGTDGIETL